MTSCETCGKEMPRQNWKYCNRVCYNRARLERMLSMEVEIEK